MIKRREAKPIERRLAALQIFGIGNDRSLNATLRSRMVHATEALRTAKHAKWACQDSRGMWLDTVPEVVRIVVGGALVRALDEYDIARRQVLDARI